MRVVMLAVAMVAMTGCSTTFWDTLGVVADALPDKVTPQERCDKNGGKWVRTFDTEGRVSGGGCVDK